MHLLPGPGTGGGVVTTIWQSNAATFASTPTSYIDAERHDAVRKTLAAIVEGRPGYALFLLARSVERQNRIAGGGTVALGVCPACGTRCTHLDTTTGDTR